LDHRLAAHKRLEEAEASKRAADAAAVSEATKPGCKTNCAQLLVTAQLTANQELAGGRRLRWARANRPRGRSATHR
jgi:hypothetical protein